MCSSMISASCISHEEEEVAKYSANYPAQVSSFVASSPCQEAMFHEESVVRRLHTSSKNIPKAVSSLEKVGEV